MLREKNSRLRFHPSILVTIIVKAKKYFKIANNFLKKKRTRHSRRSTLLPWGTLRGVASYAALAGSFLALGWLSDRLQAVPSIQLAPWDFDQAPLIVVDAGHGGHDGGAVVGAVLEKNLALTLAKQLREQLVALGIRVKMTRDGDHFLPLEERAALANELQADAFVSLHLNTSDKPEVSGIETYYTEHKSLSAQRALQQRWQLTTSAVKDKRGRWLADILQNQACTSTQAVDRGIKERNYAVVSRTQVPAVLVECGFLTHAEESARLRQADYQKQLIQGLATGIRQFVQARKGAPGKGLEALPSPALAATEENENKKATP